MRRLIIEIDREKCNGSGLCTTACAEGALELDEENKAVLVREIYCDGLGACLDVCPTDALKIIEREVKPYNAEETYLHVKDTRGEEAAKAVHGYKKYVDRTDSGKVKSELKQWPIQLHLVSHMAPCFNECHLLLSADCCAFAFGAFHTELLKGRRVAIACLKLDDTGNYVDKIAEIIKNNKIYSLTVVIMSVPCCSGLEHMVERGVELSGNGLPVNTLVVDIDGNIKTKKG